MQSRSHTAASARTVSPRMPPSILKPSLTTSAPSTTPSASKVVAPIIPVLLPASKITRAVHRTPQESTQVPSAPCQPRQQLQVLLLPPRQMAWFTPALGVVRLLPPPPSLMDHRTALLLPESLSMSVRCMDLDWLLQASLLASPLCYNCPTLQLFEAFLG